MDITAPPPRANEANRSAVLPSKWAFPKIRGPVRVIVYWGLFWGPPMLGISQIRTSSGFIKGCLKLVSAFFGRGVFGGLSAYNRLV